MNNSATIIIPQLADINITPAKITGYKIYLFYSLMMYSVQQVAYYFDFD